MTLIERLKAATGPSKEIDRLIAEQIALIPFRSTKRGREWFEDSHGGVETWLRHPPAYTASVDAALSLVERLLPGWRWGISSHYVKDGKNDRGWPLHSDGFRAHVTKRSALRPMPSIADAKTAPLALLIALLSALDGGAK